MLHLHNISDLIVGGSVPSSPSRLFPVVIFLTGFPGFLGTRLVRALADTYPDAHVHLLVQPKFAAQAKGVLGDLRLAPRATLVEGDITQPDLGLGTRRNALAAEVTRAFHLAAVYDLTIPRDVGWAVNVAGTRHVMDFLASCPKLEHAAYVSTAYVSGRRTGLVREDELMHAAGFKNFYEETKYHAEVVVRARMGEVPATVMRPAIVVGDARTGATAKFDGPYFILGALRRLPRLTLMTRIGTGRHPVNLVPADFVTDALVALARPEHAGATFHLTDPNPATQQELMEAFVDRLGMRAAYVTVPPALARRLVATPVGRTFGIAPELVDYFDVPVTYDSTRTQRALAGTGVACPPFLSYVDHIVDYVERHADARATAMY
jgi:thioester reductase-like protein